MNGGTGISVSELNLMVAEAIRRDPRTRSVTVRGEVSGFKHHIASGHWYFNLKDPEASVGCVMYRMNNLKAQIRPKDGDSVLADGYVDLYAPQGKYQLYVTGIRSAGLGDLYIRLEELKRRLAAEGLFDPGRKKALPLLPRKVAVVTSQSGAALHDILNVSGMRCPFVPIVLIPTAVQGAGAGAEIADGIRKANEETDADVIIVARGGGAAEDLMPFNEEAVARAVAASRKPVVSGVGHEVDFTLCDLAADARASTPSNAAEMVFPEQQELINRIHLIRSGLIRAVAEHLQAAGIMVRDFRQRLSACSPERRTTVLLNRTEMLCERLIMVTEKHAGGAILERQQAEDALIRAMQSRITSCDALLRQLREKLKAVSPMAVLERGYVLVYDNEGKMITRAGEARLKKELFLSFADGQVQVTGKEQP